MPAHGRATANYSEKHQHKSNMEKNATIAILLGLWAVTLIGFFVVRGANARLITTNDLLLAQMQETIQECKTQ